MRTYHRAPMSAALPDRVEVARQVQARRIFAGVLPLASMRRLRGSLATADGGASYTLEFGRDTFGIDYVDLKVETDLPLTCQRSLDVFAFHVALNQRLGLIKEEAEESALPEGYEPLLVPDGNLDLAAMIEDELILALPVVPLAPGAPMEWKEGPDDEADDVRPNPFAALGALKKH